MDLKEELERLDDAEESKEHVVACAELARVALDAGDLDVFVRAKSREVQSARGLGMHQHAVVACAELMEVLPRVVELPEVDEHTEKRLVWGLKFGAGSAMDLPEIPLATVRQLLAALGKVLARFGHTPVALWELEARLAFIEDDQRTLKDRVGSISPMISITSHINEHSDCPGCTLLQVAKWLGEDAPAEELEAVLDPVFSGRPFPRDAPMQRVYSLLYGDDAMCENAKRWAPAMLARAYARAGRLAEARAKAVDALERVSDVSGERRVRALVVSLLTELAANGAEGVAERAGEIARERAALEDPYEALDAVLALHSAYARLGETGKLASLHDEATSLARRLDARLATPRHERETAARLSR